MFKTREQHNQWHRDYQRTRYRKRLDEALDHLGRTCVDCSGTEDLQFDHIDPDTKVKSVSRMTYLSNVRFWEEVEKCTLRCISCHSKRTRQQNSL
jgi:hypothetical protein